MFERPEDALSSWPVAEGLPVRALLDGGLINNTWSVGNPPRFALQQVNAIFPPSIHDRIALVSERLNAVGITCPELIRTSSQDWTARGPKGTMWRLMTWVPGTSFHRFPGPSHAYDAAQLIGRFHQALLPLLEELEPLRVGAHDTTAHMMRLEAMLEDCASHRLAAGILEVGQGVLEGWERCRAVLPNALPLRPTHGDLKASNIRFDPAGSRAVALIDLDTLGRDTLDVELGDAFRSWCNASGEDENTARLDTDILAAGVQGYLSTADFVSADERAAIVPGTWRISLELSARFCVDAFEERYFGWSEEIAPTRGEHNLLRAQGQLSLARAIESQRASLERVVAEAVSRHSS